MTKRLLRVELVAPAVNGDTPATGHVIAKPTLRRHLETPTDHFAITAEMTSVLGEALAYTDNADVDQVAAATPGVAWFWLDVTDEGDYANLWAWTFSERTEAPVRRTIQIPTEDAVLEYGDQPDLDPDDFSEIPEPGPGWAPALAAEASTRAADDETNADAIADETERATTIEGGLDSRLDSAEGTLATLPATYAPIAVVAELDELERSKSWAKNPDTLVVGAATYSSGLLTTAAVVWPDAATGTLTITSRQSGTDAVTGYTITHVVGPTTLTYTQPTITRDVDGNATLVPQITVA